MSIADLPNLGPKSQQLLARAGFASVANLSGGMLNWRAQGYPAPGAED